MSWLFLDVLCEAFRDDVKADFRHLRVPDEVDYEVTPEWAVCHLVEHEAGHAYQMRSSKRRAAKHLGAETSG